jgi:CBS domain-containing protein
MSLDRLLDTDVTTAAPDTPVGDVAAAFREADESVLAVLDEGRPLGLVTAGDLGRAIEPGVDVAAAPVADLLVADPVTIEQSADRSALLSLFAAADARHVLVVDDEGEYVGVASLDSVLVQYGRELDDLFDLLA